MDIANQRAVQQGFCFYPEIVPGLAFAFGIGDQRCYQLQNVLFGVALNANSEVLKKDFLKDFSINII